MTNFPTSLDDATSIPVESAGTALSTNHVTSHQNVQDAIEAIEAKIGVNGSAVTTSHDYKLSGVTGTDKAVSLTGTEALTNKTLTAPTITSPKVTVGSDAVGDLHYVSNVDGTLSRLAKGSDNQILKMNGTSLNWEAETSTVNADQTTAGIVEEATAAEITAGTATGGSGASLYVSPDQLALSTPVFNGSGLTNIRVWKSGVTTHDISTTTTTTIAHGLGVAPKRVSISTAYSNSTTYGSTSVGFYDGTTTTNVYSLNNSGTIVAGSNATKIITAGLTAGNINEATVAVDATNITLTWSKTGTPTGTIQIMWEANI